jgi:hypothetical protein
MELKTCHINRNVSGSINLPEIWPTFLRKNFSYTRDYILIADFLVIVDGGHAIKISFSVFYMFQIHMFINFQLQQEKYTSILLLLKRLLKKKTACCHDDCSNVQMIKISRENKITKETLNFQTGQNIIVSTAAVTGSKLPFQDILQWDCR